MMSLLCYQAVIVLTVSVILHQSVGSSQRDHLSCPRISPGRKGTCVNRCQKDTDCRIRIHKCCSNGCGRTCQVAVRRCSVAFCAPCPFANDGTFSDDFLKTVIKNDIRQILSTKAKENFKSLLTADVLDLAKLTCKLAVVLASRLSRASSADVKDWVDAVKTGVDITKIKKTPTDVFRLFKRSLVSDMIQRMNPSQKACMCKYVLRTDAVTKAYLITQVCNQSKNKLCGVNGDTTASVCAFNAKLLSEYCVDATPPSQWTVDDMNKATKDEDRFKALCKRSETTIGQIRDDVILQSVDSLSYKCKALKDVKCKRYLKMKAKKMTTKATYTKYKVKLTKLICACGGSSRDIDSLRLTNSEFMENFCGTAEKDPKEKRRIKKMVPDLARLKRSDLPRLLPFVADDIKEVEKLNETTLLDVLSEIPPGTLKGRKAKNIFNVLRKSSKYSAFQSYTAADILDLGPNIMAVINQRSLSKIPSDAIGKALESKGLMITEFVKGHDRIVIDKYKEYLGKKGVLRSGCLTPAQIVCLGKLMSSLKPGDFECMSGPEIKGLLGNTEFKGMLQRLKSKAEIRKTIAKKVKAESGGLDVLMQLETFKDDVGDIDDSKVTEIIRKIRNGEKSDIKCSKSRCKKLLDGLGKPKTWDRETLQNLEGSEILTALSSEDIDDIDTESLDIMPYLPKSGIREKARKKFAGILEKLLNAESGDEITRSKDILKRYPKMIHMISKSILQKTGVCVIEEMEDDDMTSISSYYLKDTFDYFLTCMGLDSSSTISDTVLEEAGNLICTMQESHYGRLTKEALEEFNQRIARCPSQNLKEIKTRNKALRDTGSIPTDSANFTGDDLAILDADVSTQDISVTQNIPDVIFAEFLEDLLDAESEREENGRKRAKHGFTVDNSDQDQRIIDERENAFFKKAVNVIGSRSTSGRTRRSTQSLSCDDIEELGNAVMGITVDQVKAMQSDEFKECSGVLGGVINFRPDITLVLANKAKAAYGQTLTWSAKVIDQLGRITMGLGPRDLNVLQLTKGDIIRFGTYHGWSQPQLNALFSKFLTIQGKDISAVTDGAIGEIGNILCGATPNQISSITTDTYRQSADSIGQITNCSEGTLTALANKAKETFGNDISQWSTQIITDIGSVFGGLGPDIATLSNAQIEAIDETDFRYIPSSSLAEFTVAQLSYFSRVQAEASLRQSCDLPNDKRQQLLTVSGLTNDPCPGKTLTKGQSLMTDIRKETSIDSSITTNPDITSTVLSTITTPDITSIVSSTMSYPDITSIVLSRTTSPDITSNLSSTMTYPDIASGSKSVRTTTETTIVSSTTSSPDNPSTGTVSEGTLNKQTPETCPQQECPLACKRRFCSRMFESNNKLKDSALSVIIRGNNVFKQQTKKKFEILKPLLSEFKLTCDRMSMLIRLLTRMSVSEIQDIKTQNIGRTVDIRKFMKIHPCIMKMFKTSVLNRFIQKLNSNMDKACLCKMSYKFDCITRSTIQSATCGALDCSEADLTSNLRCSVTKQVAKQVKKKCLLDKTAVTPSGDWTTNDYKSYLTDQEAAEVLAEKANALDRIDENTLLTKKSILRRTCANTTRNVKDKYKAAVLRLGERISDNTARDSFIELAKVCGAKPNDLTFGSDTQKLSVFDDSQVEDPAEKWRIGKIFDQTYSMQQLDKQNIIRFFKLFVENEQKMELLRNDVFLEALPYITKKNMSMQAAQNVVKKFRSARQSPSLTSFTDDDVVSLGCAMKSFRKSEIKRIPDSAIAVPLFNGNLAKVEWTKAQAKEMYKKAKRHHSLSNADITSRHLKNFGVSFVLRILREVPSNVLKTLLDEDNIAQKFKEKLDDSHASTIKVLRRKLRSVPGGKNVLLKLGGGFVKSVTLDDSDREQVATDLQNGQRVLKTFSKSEGRKVLKKLNKPDKLSSEDFENLEKSNLLGLVQPSDAKKIFETDFMKGLDFVKSLGKSNSNPSEKLIEDCIKTLEDKIRSATTRELSVIEDSIQHNADILWRLSPATLRKLRNPEALITRMKDADVSSIPCQKMKGKFSFFLEIKNLISANEISAKDCKDAGNLLCSATPSEYRKLSMEAYKECNPSYSKCPCRQTTTEDRLRIQSEKPIPMNGAQFTGETIAILGTDILTQPEDVIRAIQKSVLKMVLHGVLRNGKERDAVKRRRRRKGFQNDVSSSEEKQNRKRRKVFVQMSIRMILNIRASRLVRRRRSTSTLTCDEMRSIPTALSALTLEQLGAITTSDFSDCVDILGQIDSFSSEQEEALALKAIETWGPTNGWDSSHIDNAGRILQGLSVNDINTLTLTEDQIFTMGTFDDWEESKKKALFTNYLTLAGHSDASTITGSQLQSLSHIVCGAETNQLSQISPTHYGAAADSIGDVTSCSEQQLTELATVAKAYYSSNITAWTDATMTELGIVIGGLPRTDIAQLTESHIDAIESGDIYYLPPTSLSYFSTTQFGYFSSAQAQAVSEGQRNAMSSEQISALESAAGISFSTTHSNCSTLTMSWAFLLTVVLFALTEGTVIC